MIDKDALMLNGYSDAKIKKLEEEMVELRRSTAEQVSIATLISTGFHLVVDEAYETAVFGLLDAFEKRRPDLIICDFMGMACIDVCAHLHIPYMIMVFSLAYIDHLELPKYIPNQHIGRSFFSITFWKRFYDKFILGPRAFALIFLGIQKMNRI
ncbi:unnamed protein product [Rotaria socialis]|nr:unnamed protein product [Rotaria socialis]CAF4719317.1 unnamed protein product [Rotaria socialis]